MNTKTEVQPFRSIRLRFLVFSILVTLLPALGIGWFWYDLTRKVTTEKIEQQLLDSASFAEREIALWLKERLYDLRVFANSPLIQEALQFHNGNQTATVKNTPKTTTATRKLSNYLSLIRDQYGDYRNLLLVDASGTSSIAAADSSESGKMVALPANWQEQINKWRSFCGDVYTRDDEKTPLILCGIPLLAEQNSLPQGLLVMEIRLTQLPHLLKSSLPLNGNGRGRYQLRLFSQENTAIATTDATADASTPLTATAPVNRLLSHPRRLLEYRNDQQQRAIGVALPLSYPAWTLVVSENYDSIYAGLKENRNRIILITVLLTVAIGGIATIIASQIITPLQELTRAVRRVAGGELEVAVPVHRPDELGLVAAMFNTMTVRLKDDQQALEVLATTDALTGLANRKQILTTLEQQLELFHRYGTGFSILMLDIDHFKAINDSYGHLAGDAALVQLAQILRDTLRNIDSAGRYGGEEFLIILGQTSLPQAMLTAERIRQAVIQHQFIYDKQTIAATVSIGVAEIAHNDSSTMLIGRADQALYAAKGAGRNRVAASKGKESFLFTS